MISQALGPDYFMVSSVSLQATHLVVFMHKNLCRELDECSTNQLAVGWNGVMGNKGAVKLEFILSGRKYIFINAHLHSGQGGVSKRNKDID